MKTIKKPLDCQRVRELLFEYADGALDTKQSSAILSHLEGCEACKRELDDIKAMLGALSECAKEPPESLFDGVMAKLDGVKQEPAVILGGKRRFIPMGTVAAACAVVMMLVVGRHVIFNPGTADVAVNDEASNLGVVGTFAGEADYDGEFTAAPTSLSDAPSEVQAADVSNDTVEVTTEAVKANAPSYSYSSQTPSETQAPGAMPDKLSEGTVTDSVFSQIEFTDSAVVVCLESEFIKALSGEYDELSFGGVRVHLYTESSGALRHCYECIEALTDAGVYFRNAMPSDFSSFRLYLICDTEN